MHYHFDLARRDGGESELAPDLVVASHTAVLHIDPITAIQVLHVKGCDAIETEGLGQRRLNGIIEIVLARDDINLVDCLASTFRLALLKTRKLKLEL